MINREITTINNPGPVDVRVSGTRHLIPAAPVFSNNIEEPFKQSWTYPHHVIVIYIEGTA